ncbi:hypothetical protein BC833DRAFT_584651 [Globomyces pollinis-pini]|nr:hypothetical protein BC833DRAFT_584651 [Globomyces pollinis-pini]KAJ2994726.1 hypothetical protein HDV02_001338 [Globomyces sp. JEL0801]
MKLQTLLQASIATAATFEVYVTDKSFSRKEIQLNEGDSLYFLVTQGENSISQVDSDSSCNPLANGFNSGKLVENQSYNMPQFNTPGVYHFASLIGGSCQNSRITVNVKKLPVNPYAYNPNAVSKAEAKEEKNGSNVLRASLLPTVLMIAALIV